MILFDAHVHIYDNFDLDLLIDSAFANFQRAMSNIGIEDSCTCFLLLTESGELDFFSSLRQLVSADGEESSHKWKLEETGESCSIHVNHPDYPTLSLIIVAGRQIVTAERLEVLALITEERFSDGMTLEETVSEVVRQEGLPVCAWGAGKWLGRRGDILSAFMQSNSEKSLYLGDSGGRPSIWPVSKLLQRPGYDNRVLSGTDPLSLTGEERRVGSFGGYLTAECSQTSPAACLKKYLLEDNVDVLSFGKSQNPFLFVKNQVALRLQR